MIEARPITEDEANVVRAMLANFAVRPVSAAAIEAVSMLNVVERCPCGCASVDFVKRTKTEPRPSIVADAVATTPTGERVGLMVWGHADAVTALELYELDPGSNRRLPDPASIQSYFPTD